MKYLSGLLILFLLITVKNVSGTHIVGGEMNYTYLGNNIYRISLTVYRDCFNGIPPFDNPASVGIFSASTFALVREKRMLLGNIDTVPPTINSPCFIPPTNICYERTTYIDTLFLPPSPAGYYLAYQRCCRNFTILNIILPDATGATYDARIAGTSTFSQNSNPVFTNWPPPFICAGIPFNFDHSATDAEGDSIVYELCNPLDGGDTLNPRPQPPNPPPYNPVFYQSPYSVGNMLGGNPQLSINPVTGQLTCTPTTVGQFVIGVCAREFRGGILVGYTRRDFQLNVVPCPSLVVAALQNPIIKCGSNSVLFENLSFNAGSYLWDFGIPGSSTDTSTQVEPVFTYPDTGTYTVTLIAYSSFNPGCADTTEGTVTVLPPYVADFTFVKDTCSNLFSFNDTSNSISGVTNTWNWIFGNGSSSQQPDPTILYQNPGNYTVTLFTSSTRGCRDTVTRTLQALPVLTAAAQLQSAVRCSGECNGIALASAQNGEPPYSYQWNDPLQQSSTLADSLCAGIYSVIVTDSLGCRDSSQITVSTPAPLQINTVSQPDYCGGICAGQTASLVSGGNGAYTYSWNDPGQQTSATAVSLCPGFYTVQVSDSRGCSISDTITVQYRDSFPVVDATASTTVLFTGQSTNLNATNGQGYTYQWFPSDWLSNATLQSPVANPLQSVLYTVIATDANGCTARDSVFLEVKDVLCKEPELFIPTAFSPNGDNKNDLFLVRGNTIESIYFAVYDRWGELVFESNQRDKGWDGTFRGKEATSDVYVYYVNLTCVNKDRFEKKGNITLIR